MEIKKTAGFFYLILQTVSSYNMSCPSVGNWNYRAGAFCDSPEQYICLRETVKDIYVEQCRGPRQEIDGFQTTINQQNFDKITCSSERYQPLTFSTEGNSDCVFLKSFCSEEGQIRYDPDDISSEYDIGCICDFTRGYALLHREENSCFCVPSSVTDCSCYKKTCSYDEVLTQEYKCIRKVQIGYDLKDDSCKKITTGGNADMEDSVMRIANGKEQVQEINVAGSPGSASVAVILFLIMMFCVFVIISYRHEISRSNSKEDVLSDDGICNKKDTDNDSLSFVSAVESQTELTASSKDKAENPLLEGNTSDNELILDSSKVGGDTVMKNEQLQDTVQNEDISGKSCVPESEEMSKDNLQEQSTLNMVACNEDKDIIDKRGLDDTEFNMPVLLTNEFNINGANNAGNRNSEITDARLHPKSINIESETRLQELATSEVQGNDKVLITEASINSTFSVKKEDGTDEKENVFDEDNNKICDKNTNNMKDTCKDENDSEEYRHKPDQEDESSNNCEEDSIGNKNAHGITYPESTGDSKTNSKIFEDNAIKRLKEIEKLEDEQEDRGEVEKDVDDDDKDDDGDSDKGKNTEDGTRR